MTYIAKGAVLATTLGTTVTGAYIGSSYLIGKSSNNKKEKQSIGALLTKNKPEKRMLLQDYQGIKDGSSAAWKKVWKQYRTDYQNFKSNPFNLVLTKSESVQDENASEDFMSACSSLFEEEIEGTESDRYLLADKYCTKLASVSDLVWESGKKVLADDSNGQSQEWKNLWEKYRNGNQSKGASKDVWTLSGSPWTGVSGSQVDAPQDFRNKCGTESQVETWDKRNNSFLNVLEYCSVPQ